MNNSSSLKPYYIMSVINIVLIVITGFAGLFISGTYEKFIEPLHLAESQGQDFTSIFVGLPLLIVSLLWTRKGLLRGPIFWVGALGYFLYVNIVYAYGGVYNILFFAYVGICGLSLFSIIGILLAIKAKRIHHEAIIKIPNKINAAYFFCTAVLLTVMWGAMAAVSITVGKTADANVIIVTDFMIVIPAFILTAVWLWQRKKWGYLLSGVLLVQAATLGISIVAGQVIAISKSVEPSWGLAGFFTIFALIGLILAIRYLKHLQYIDLK